MICIVSHVMLSLVSLCLLAHFMCSVLISVYCFFFFQAEDGIRDLVRSRGLGDVYKRQHVMHFPSRTDFLRWAKLKGRGIPPSIGVWVGVGALSLIHI